MVEKPFQARYLGLVIYDSALTLQLDLNKARIEGKACDTLLLLQHPPVITVGKFRGEAEILVSSELLNKEGIAFHNTNRGGSVTYHGPGQLVGYPIINIKTLNLGIKDYIWKLEEVIIKFLQRYDINGHREPEHQAGVWVNHQKICSIGINVKSYVSMHGFALNVNNDLKYFNYINPCGIKSNNIMTSMAQQLGYDIKIEDIVDTFITDFAETFGLKYVKETCSV